METKFYRFYSEVNAFIESLFKNPFKANVTEYLKERGFTKKKLIEELIKKKIIVRSEKVDSNEEGKPSYKVKFSRYDDNIKRKIKRMFSNHFEKNLPKKELKETDCGCIAGATSCDGSTGQFLGPINKKPISGHPLYESKKGKKSRKIYLTEKQFERLKKKISESTTCGSVGNIAYDSPRWCDFKTSDGKEDPAYKR